jgi:polyphosphate kinase 2 (PPK2 family)
MKIEKMLKRYRIEEGKHFWMKDHDPGDTHGLKSESKLEARELLTKGVQELARLQDILAAQDGWAVLPIFRPWTRPAGWNDLIMPGVNPQGVQVTSFPAPPAKNRITTSRGGR